LAQQPGLPQELLLPLSLSPPLRHQCCSPAAACVGKDEQLQNSDQVWHDWSRQMLKAAVTALLSLLLLFQRCWLVAVCADCYQNFLYSHHQK